LYLIVAASFFDTAPFLGIAGFFAAAFVFAAAGFFVFIAPFFFIICVAVFAIRNSYHVTPFTPDSRPVKS
jgi:hypothetical protein